MITTYFKAVTLKIPPIGSSAKVGRLFLTGIPPKLRSQLDLKFKLLEPNEKAELKVVFKDDTALEADINELSMKQVADVFDRYSRKLKIQDAINS